MRDRQLVGSRAMMTDSLLEAISESQIAFQKLVAPHFWGITLCSSAYYDSRKLWTLAMFVALTVPQLACLSYFPAPDVLLEWSAWSVLRPKCAAEVVHTWESQYLLGVGQCPNFTFG